MGSMIRKILTPSVSLTCAGIVCGFAFGFLYRDVVFYSNREMPTIILQRPEEWEALVAQSRTATSTEQERAQKAVDVVCEPIIKQVTKEVRVPVESTCEPQVIIVREPCSEGACAPADANTTASNETADTAQEQEETVEETTLAQSEPQVQVIDQVCENGRYCNGDYSVVINYEVSDGSDAYVNARIVLEDDEVQYATASYGATSQEVQQWQSEFDNDFRKLVIGKSLDDVALSRVGGASLTTDAYQQAVELIEDEARN